jgi:alpha-tubulin suppressor-like RCC1 family protein
MRLKRVRILRSSFLIIGLGVWSCAKDATAPPPPPPPPTLGPAAGHWTADGPDFITALDLSDTVVVATGRGTVQGSGTFTGPGIAGGDGAFTVTGTDSSSKVRLTFTATGHTNAYFTGQVVADTEMVGNLDSSGFSHLALTFSHNPVVVSITVAPQSDSTLPGRTVQFTDIALDLLGRLLAPQAVTWATTDSTLATISATGLMTAVAPGPVTVQANFHGVVGAAPMQVLRPVVSVIVHPPAQTFAVPATVPLSATLLDATGNVITGRAITWVALNSVVARVTLADSVKAEAPGSTDVRATVVLDGRSGLTHVTVRTVQVTQLAAGVTHTCGIDADSSVACWGEGLVGQLGSAIRTIAAAPLFVSGGLHFATLVAGHVHTCGLTADSTAYCWGGDGSGQLGDGDAISDTVPVPVTGGLKFVTLVIGYDHTCGLVAGGAPYCWGSNLSGELGNGSTNQVPNPNPVPVSGGLTVTSLTAGNAHTCGLAPDSTAYCWGGNDFGSLGDSTTTSRSIPAPVTGGLKFATISAGAFHTCGLTSAGAAYCWGVDASAQLGDSSGNIQQIIPVAVHSAGVLFTSISSGGGHTCARATSGDIYCWGASDNGQVGPNAGVIGIVPTSVGLTGTSVVAGGFHTCAITPNGAYCWGFNQFGELGSGSTFPIQSAMPLRVSGQP